MTKKRKGKRHDPFGNRIKEIMKWEATDGLTPFTIRDGFTAAHSWELPEANRYMRKCLEMGAEFTLLTDESIKDTVPHENPYEDNLSA